MILGRLSGGVAEYDRDGRLRTFNPAYPRHVGLPPDSMRPGMTLAEVLAALEAAGGFANLSDERRAALPWGGLHGERSTERTRPDGGTLWTRSTPLPGGGHLVEVDEITSLRRAEEEARARAALLDAVLDALPHGVCVYGPDRRVTAVNAAYQRIMAGAEVAVGEHHEAVVARRLASGEYDADAPAAVMRALAEDGGAAFDRVRVRPNGTVLSVRAARLPDGGHITVMTDVTARDRAEREAARRATILRDMLENQGDGVALYDSAGRLLAANALAAVRTGLSPEVMRPGPDAAGDAGRPDRRGGVRGPLGRGGAGVRRALGPRHRRPAPALRAPPPRRHAAGGPHRPDAGGRLHTHLPRRDGGARGAGGAGAGAGCGARRGAGAFGVPRGRDA
jgi:PAS domain-containing protein